MVEVLGREGWREWGGGGGGSDNGCSMVVVVVMILVVVVVVNIMVVAVANLGIFSWGQRGGVVGRGQLA